MEAIAVLGVKVGVDGRVGMVSKELDLDRSDGGKAIRDGRRIVPNGRHGGRESVKKQQKG